MIKGYMYYFTDNYDSNIELPIDSDVDQFKETMEYKDLFLKNIEDFKHNFLKPWQYELHDTLTKVIDKTKLTIGIGSGYGEHELLFHLKGYNIIASDIIPGIGNCLKLIGNKFNHCYINILNDNINDIISNELNLTDRNYDILVTGLDFYFTDEVTNYIFQKIYGSLANGSNLIFTLRYRDYYCATYLERIIYIENLINSIKLKKRLVCKERGYRRSENEIVNFAKKCGFICEGVYPTLLGYEMNRSYTLSKISLFKLFGFLGKSYPMFYSATVFKFRKP